MAFGDILCSKKEGTVVYGKNGTILYEDLQNIIITISWKDGNDVDILGRFTGSDQYVGYGQGSRTIRVDGFYAHWRGDNTRGGPEYIDVYASNEALSGEKSFEVYCNWFNAGEGHSGGPVTITVEDNFGTSLNVSFDAGRRIYEKAKITDPGARISFDDRGYLKSIVKIN